VEDDVDAAEGALVGSGAVAAAAGMALAVVSGVDVEAAVRLAERPHVGAHVLVREQAVEPDQVAVAGAAGDRSGGEDLVTVVVVGGGDVEHRPGPSDLPAADRVGEVAAPGAEGLDHRRVLVDRVAEVAEVGRVTGVGDAEVDLAIRRFE